MDDNFFASLDRIVEAGGQKLAKGIVIGDLAKKAAVALLADLEAHNYIRKDGNKYSITDEGRRAWEGKAPAARKRELADRVVAKFLAVVKQTTKALGKPQQKLFEAAFIQQVEADELVVGTGANKYKLTPRGEAFLQDREPLEAQLKRLQTAAHDLLKAPQSLLHNIVKEAEQLAEGGAIRAAFAEARTAIQEEVTRAQKAFEHSLNGLQAFASLIAAAQTLKKELPAAVAGALERIDATAERVEKLETELRQTTDHFKEQLDQARHEMERRAAAVEAKAQAERTSASVGETTSEPTRARAAEPPTDEVVWQATRRAYEHLEQQFKMTSELIKVPNLTDIACAEVPGLTAARFHDLLQRWQREDRLVLQVCNDPHFEPRAAEGIHSSRGLLFYVEMK